MASRKEGITFYLLLFLSRGKLFCIYVVEKPSETQKGFSHDFRITLHCNAPLGRAAKHHLHLKKYATFFRSIVAPKTGWLLLLSLFFALRKSLLLNFRKVYDGSRLSKPLACYYIAFELPLSQRKWGTFSWSCRRLHSIPMYFQCANKLNLIRRPGRLGLWIPHK